MASEDSQGCPAATLVFDKTPKHTGNDCLFNICGSFTLFLVSLLQASLFPYVQDGNVGPEV